jgi:stage V sporulation protein K
MAAFMKRRMELGLDTELDNRHHMLFLGNPGTGKTTVAKLIGQLYHQMGLLSSGHTIETCRTKLVGEYIGETEKHIRQAIEEARGGVLFIDEAYTLITTKQETKDFGKEVIHALLTVLSEPNPDMIIILAGYEDKMQQMLRTNPGLQERFPLQFYFDDYNADELMEMAHRLLQKRNFQLTSEADKELYTLIVEATAQRDEYFGNGRWLHNLIEQGIIKCMAQRIMSQPSIPDNTFLFRTITQEDVVKAGNRLRGKQVVKLEPQPIRRIRFRA